MAGLQRRLGVLEKQVKTKAGERPPEPEEP
jgi:hypothetical protein